MLASLQRINKLAQLVLATATLAYGGLVCAETTESSNDKAQLRFVTSDNPNHSLQLIARQIRLPAVLDTLSRQTHIPIHYSQLPDNVVTINCLEQTLKAILECLLDHQADLIVRYSNPTASIVNRYEAAEVWIVNAKETVNKLPSGDFPSQSSINSNQATRQSRRIDKLLKKAQSPDPKVRAQAIGAFISEGNVGNMAAINSVLEKALTDKDARVRAQAISSYAHHADSALVTQAIRHALVDSSTDVRMMAVDSITNDVTLLQQATDDSDDTIRNLAIMKLNALVGANNKTKNVF